MRSRAEITINSLNSEGEGVGSLNGLKIFINEALPEEIVSIEISEKKKTYAKGQLLSVLKPSTSRVQPPCPLFGQCGGCQIMHASYPLQLKLKRLKVAEALRRIGGFQNPEVLPCIPSPKDFDYRNKIQLPVLWDNDKSTLGLYRKNSHEVIPIERCKIQSPLGNEILALISKKLTIPSIRYVLIRTSQFYEEALVIFVTTGSHFLGLKQFATDLIASHPAIKGVHENINRKDSNTILGTHTQVLAGQMYIREKLLGKTFKISPTAFFQVNPAQTENLYTKAIQLAAIQPHEIVLDAYCGVGTLAIFASIQAKHVYGIECVPNAIADARANSVLNKLSNLTFMCGQAEKLIHKIPKVDTVFLNPPRKGCAPELLSELLIKKPEKIIYISCDPATLARDLARLQAHYSLHSIQPFDMFPQTMHVETVVSLQKKNHGLEYPNQLSNYCMDHLGIARDNNIC